MGHCLQRGIVPECLFVCGEILQGEDRNALLPLCEKANPDCQVVEVPSHLYSRIAYREGTEGILGVMRTPPTDLESFRGRLSSPNPLVIVLEGVEKPGNIGAILRSADAAGVDGVLICDSPTDLFNPNLIRASIGAVFTRNIALCSTQEAIEFLREESFSVLTAQLQDSRAYYDTDMKGATAIVMGTEATGLTPAWRQAATSHIMIPMLGQLDSLNVSVSAAILLFEAVRQRQTT